MEVPRSIVLDGDVGVDVAVTVGPARGPEREAVGVQRLDPVREEAPVLAPGQAVVSRHGLRLPDEVVAVVLVLHHDHVRCEAHARDGMSVGSVARVGAVGDEHVSGQGLEKVD